MKRELRALDTKPVGNEAEYMYVYVHMCTITCAIAVEREILRANIERPHHVVLVRVTLFDHFLGLDLVAAAVGLLFFTFGIFFSTKKPAPAHDRLPRTLSPA